MEGYARLTITIVIPVCASNTAIQRELLSKGRWIPACAGMT